MADLILGTQGSGKSYFATKKIVDDRDKYLAVYTNIADFKYQGNIKELVPQKFFDSVVTILWGRFKENNNISDLEQKKKLLELLALEPADNFRILIVIDEAHNFLGKKNEVVQWFMTYHRHLNIDYFLITQLLTSITTDNRIFNNIYEAYPVSRQFFKSKIRYKHYLALPLVEGNLSKKFSLKKEQKYFDMYHSGDIVQSDKGEIKKNIFILVVLLSVIVFGFQYFLTHFGTTSDESNLSGKNVEVPKALSSLKSNKDDKEFDELNSPIYTYFVDLGKKELYCSDTLLVLPLALCPKPIYFTKHGLGFVRFFYRKELEACISVEDRRERDKNAKG